jgi:hypothetical protein
MTDDTPAALWWRTLTPETRSVWLIHITGWTLPAAIAEAYALAQGERDLPPTREIRPVSEVLTEWANDLPPKETPTDA